MEQEDYVRGKKRQRKKTSKARSGCATCKIRRIKCDETKPDCKKCTSTGRKCDGYVPPATFPVLGNLGAATSCSTPFGCTRCSTALDPTGLSSCSTQSLATLFPISFCDCGAGSPMMPPNGMYFKVRSVSEAHANIPIYEPPNQKPTRQLLPLGFQLDCIPGRSIDYFINRSSVDLTGPLQSRVWRDCVLSVGATSPAIQHAVAALAGFHERYSFPENAPSDTTYWREYYLAVKRTNVLVKTASKQERARKPTTTNEILIACIIFTTIEILLGNTDAALRHLHSGTALLQDYLDKDLSHDRQPPHPDVSHAGLPKIEPKYSSKYDSLTTDIIGFFARLALQVHSFLPERQDVIAKKTLPVSPLQSLFQHPRLPLTIPFSLYGIIEQTNRWIRLHATPHKYACSIPLSLYQTQGKLFVELEDWKRLYLDNHPEETNWIKTCINTPYETAHLLINYHLIYLKLLSALSPSEMSYLTAISMRSFGQMISYACVILKQRNRKMHPIYLPEGESQKEFYFSLESSIVEALYFTALKCRHRILRRTAMGLLKCAGREGLWDGFVMATVAEYVLQFEEDGPWARPADIHNAYSYGTSKSKNAANRAPQVKLSNSDIAEVWQMNFALDQDRVLAFERDEATEREMHMGCEGGGLVNEVKVSPEKSKNTVEVECGWFSEGERVWKYENASLPWP